MIKQLKGNMMRLGSPMASYITNRLGKSVERQFPEGKEIKGLHLTDPSIPLLHHGLNLRV